ncbi:SH3 domain-containing protein [Mycena sp. CBHHK59/15]|nr:SH3 domain-containing protein [Mycena sp. CBHHK59/15]
MGGPTAAVRYEFIPTLPDELSITTGETVRVLSEYDDGWALCANARGEEGMVPLECLDRASSSQLQVQQQQDHRNSRRTSSLGVRY